MSVASARSGYLLLSLLLLSLLLLLLLSIIIIIIIISIISVYFISTSDPTYYFRMMVKEKINESLNKG